MLDGPADRLEKARLEVKKRATSARQDAHRQAGITSSS
jgi:hypothetical protein